MELEEQQRIAAEIRAEAERRRQELDIKEWVLADETIVYTRLADYDIEPIV